VVNFAVKKDGLEAQLLGIVVQKEEPNLEKQKSELVIRVAAGKRQLVELEDQILKLLSESTGSLLVCCKETSVLCVYASDELYYEI
jgi:dynein heavy chain